MKRTAIAALVLAFIVGSSVIARQQTEVAASRAQVEAERDAVIEKNLELTPAEKKTFWPVYQEYREKMSQTDDLRGGLIRKFAEEYPQLTDAQALAMLNEYFQFRQAKVTLQTSYIEKFTKVLSSKKVGRYYQIENLIDTRTDFELMKALPLMK